VTEGLGVTLRAGGSGENSPHAPYLLVQGKIRRQRKKCVHIGKVRERQEHRGEPGNSRKARHSFGRFFREILGLLWRLRERTVQTI